MSALVPAASATSHSLTWTGQYAGARQALSFFARAEAGQFVGVSAGTRGTAIFDVASGRLVAAPDGVRTTIEDWGDGLFRCAYQFEPEAGALAYQILLFADASGKPAIGDGATAFVDLAELELDVGQAYPGSPLASAIQPADQLTFIADDGNLPTSTSVSQRLEVLLPVGPRITDQALLNLNRGGTFDNQVQLYITGDTGELKFWGLRDGDTHWAFAHPASIIDGLRHTIRADWGPSLAELSVDGVSLQQSVENVPAFSLDRIDVSFSSNSSGSLEGLIGGLEIGPRTPTQP